MKFSKRNDRISKEGVRPGFNDADVIYLNRQTHTPKTQIFYSEEIIEDPEQETFFCALCKSKLDYIKKMQMYTCIQCVEYYDLNTQTTPLKDVTDTQLRPYADLIKYPTADADDIPFFEGIDLSKQQEVGLESRVNEDQRIQKMNLHNVTFADAIRAGALTAKKKSEDVYYRH